ncbi:MAG TPA: BMP family ABC transporter substrate-binding protein, partial [Acidimicrobiales bacterium]|nr:BMP family ABC transporter substrate-binding protein [Acidimicrobiales bacterium]
MQRRWSRPAALLLAAALLSAACGDDDEAGEAGPPEDVTTIGVLLEPGGGDDAATSATIEQAETELEVVVEALEPSIDGSDRVELLDLLAADVDLVIAIGGGAQQDVEDIAADHPDLPFAIIGGSESASPNVTSVQVRAEQAAYLAGAVAALSSPTRHLGFVGGAEDAATRALQAGFTAGALRIDRATKVDVAYLPPGAATDVVAAT